MKYPLTQVCGLLFGRHTTAEVYDRDSIQFFRHGRNGKVRESIELPAQSVVSAFSGGIAEAQTDAGFLAVKG